RREAGGLVISNAVRLDLLGREIFGDVDRNLLQAQLLRGLPAGVPADDNTVGVDDNRLTKTELTERGRDSVDSIIVDAWVLVVRGDIRQRAKFDLHDDLLGETGCKNRGWQQSGRTKRVA